MTFTLLPLLLLNRLNSLVVFVVRSIVPSVALLFPINNVVIISVIKVVVDFFVWYFGIKFHR